MFHIMHKLRPNRDEAEVAQPRHTAGAVYTLRTGELASSESPGSADQAQGHLDAWDAEQAIDVRVDWDGRAASPGRLEVQVDPGVWQPCELIGTSGSNHVIAPRAEVTGEVLRVRFQRGPEHPRCRFAVKAIPIVWLQTLEDELAPTFVAERGTDYDYADDAGAQLVPWVYSVIASGTRELTVELPVGRDYEVWVWLQAPGNPHDGLSQESVVRTGSGGGNPHGQLQQESVVRTGSGGGNPHGQIQ